MSIKKHSYLEFISDEDLFECISDMFKTYEKEYTKMTFETLTKNKIDPIKMFFDIRMRNLNEKDWVLGEIARQVDRTISNEIGNFHEKIISKIEPVKGRSKLILDKEKKYSIDLYSAALDMFVEVKNKHNTLKGEDRKSVFNKLAFLADKYQNSICYLVTIVDHVSKNRPWSFEATYQGEKSLFSHSRVKEITADEFYFLLTGNQYAFKELCEKLPEAIDDFLKEQHSVILDQERVLTEKYSLASKLIIDSQKRGWNLETFLCSESFKKSKYKGFILKE